MKPDRIAARAYTRRGLPPMARIAHGLWAGFLAAVAVGSMMPKAAPTDTVTGLDKALHGLAYALLSGLAMALFRDRKTALLLALAMAPLGFALEMAQAHIPGRTFSPEDLIANNIGVLVGLGAGILWRVKRHYDRKKAAPGLSS